MDIRGRIGNNGVFSYRLPMSKTAQLLLDELSPSLRLLAQSGIVRRFARKTRFISEGEEGTSIYIVLSGKVKAFSCDGSGKEFVFSVCGPGSILGEMALDGQPRSASVEALTDTDCAIVRIDALREQIARDPDFAMTLIRTLIQRSRNTTTFARRLALESTYERLVGLLDGLAIEQDGQRIVPEPLTQQDIARRIGSSRDMVSKLFKELVKGEYLSHENKRLTLLRTLPARW
jgi:CRP/FNR family cyclic AMP-dependent transcriptional regulator